MAISDVPSCFALFGPFSAPRCETQIGLLRVKLTSRLIDAIKGEAGKHAELSDEHTRGLYLRVSPSGVKSWMVRYTRLDGSRAKLGLGRYPAVGLADARQKALKLSAEVADGRDPARDRAAARRAARRPRLDRPRTLNDLWTLYDRDVMPTKRPTTARHQRWLWSRHIGPRLGFLELEELDRGAVRAALKEIGSTGPTTANRALGLIRHMLNVAVDEELLAASPISRMAKPFKEGSRDRVLKDHEIKALWRALDAVPESHLQISPRLCAAIKLALITGARGVEVIGIHADEIDLASQVWTIPADRFKGKRAHTVPLSRPALAELEIAFGCPARSWRGLAFPNSVHTGKHMERMSLTRAMQEIVRDAGIERATPHDLRRTMATFMASERIGVPPHVITAVLGHAAEGAAVTRIYNRHTYDKEKRSALEAWAAVLMEIVDVSASRPAIREEVEYRRIAS